MAEPIFVVLAAGLGSRYGGAKQIDPVGPGGRVIIDYSMYDAAAAGFKRLVFIIGRNGEEAFKAAVGKRAAALFPEVRYAIQELHDLPEGFSLPAGRVKPWGTAHAVLSARELIDAPFAVINADDWYGPAAYRMVYNKLKNARDGEKYSYCMVGYRLKNTLSDKGKVARGVCEVGPDGRLTGMTERTYVVKTPDGAAYSEDEGVSLRPLDPNSVVSMNFFGFTPSFIEECRRRFPLWLAGALRVNPLKAEYFLPLPVNELLCEDRAEMEVLPSHDMWFGVTYREDKPVVVDALARMTAAGLYPKD